MTRRDIEQQWECASQDFDDERYIVIQPFGTVSTPEYAHFLMLWQKERGQTTVNHH